MFSGSMFAFRDGIPTGARTHILQGAAGLQLAGSFFAPAPPDVDVHIIGWWCRHRLQFVFEKCIWKEGRTSNKICHEKATLPETNIAPENGWLKYYPFGIAYFQGRTVSFRECKTRNINCNFCEKSLPSSTGASASKAPISSSTPCFELLCTTKSWARQSLTKKVQQKKECK